MPKKNKDRFAYEEAEAVMDAYARSSTRTRRFRRSYAKFKSLLVLYALLDHRKENDKRLTKLSLSRAWEDAQISFIGRGEYLMMGGVMQLWLSIDKAEYPQWLTTIDTAFRRAEECTDPDVQRMYDAPMRLGKPRSILEGFSWSTCPPRYGRRIYEQGLDEFEEFLRYGEREGETWTQEEIKDTVLTLSKLIE